MVQPLGGESGDVLVDGTNLKVKTWSADETADTVDTTNKSSGGYQEMKGTIKRMTGSCSADWRINANPGSAPPSMYAGKEVTMKLEITEDGPYYQFGAIINSIATENPVEGVVNYTLGFTSTGVIIRPGETVSES